VLTGIFQDILFSHAISSSVNGGLLFFFRSPPEILSRGCSGAQFGNLVHYRIVLNTRIPQFWAPSHLAFQPDSHSYPPHLLLPFHSDMLPVHRTSPARDLLHSIFDFRYEGRKYETRINALRAHCQSFGGLLPHNEVTATVWTAVPCIVEQRSRLSYEDEAILNAPPSMIAPPLPTFNVPFEPFPDEPYIISTHAPRSSTPPTDTEASDFTECCFPHTEPPVLPSPTHTIIPSSISPPTSSTTVADNASSTNIENMESKRSSESTDNLPKYDDLVSDQPSVGNVRFSMLREFRTIWLVRALPYGTCSLLSIFVSRRKPVSTKRSPWPLAWVCSTPKAHSHQVICNVAWTFSSPTPMDPFPCSPCKL
jgi:hypothetical protein